MIAKNIDSPTLLTPLELLRSTFSWPQQAPRAQQVDWCLDAGGKHLVERIIRSKSHPIVLEIGSFVGGSAKRWLECSPNVTVICVDPWAFETPLRDFARRQGQTAATIRQLEQPDGVLQTFLANLWSHRQRVIPIRGRSPEALFWIDEHWVQPDVIYLDADKSGSELEVCRQLFPQARITGDDWWYGRDRWSNPDDGYPIRQPVREFCRKHGCYLRTDKSTWVIDDQPPSLTDRLSRPSYHFKAIRRRFRGLFRNAIGKV